MSISSIGQEASNADSRAGDVSAVPEDTQKRRRVAFASGIGTLIESYDFAIYGTAAALVFPTTFFPSLGASAGLVATFATLGVAFVTRPFGAVLFGYLGDRYGRKATLIATILGMGIGTALIGLVPTAATIGIAAPILVITLRAIQGIAFGGEWAGAQLFATEHAPQHRRGLYAMFPQFGNGAANILSPLTVLAVSASMSQETFISWGWRIPFLASAVLVLVALYIRLNVEETPVFIKDKQRSAPSRPPVTEAFKEQPGAIFRGAGMVLTTFIFLYTVQAFFPNYGVQNLGLSRNNVLAATALAGVFYTASCVLSAVMADRIGRRPIVGGAALAGVLWALVLFPILNTATIPTFAFAMCMTTTIAGLNYGAVGALLPEQFPTRYRYTATGLAYNFSGAAGGGIVPLLAPIIISGYGTSVYGIMLAALSLIAAICTFSLTETINRSMDWTPDRTGR